jgi:dephospho-CoA kinase
MPSLTPQRTVPRVGITGGIGSGKSTVCRIFANGLGIPVFYADIWAKQLLQADPALKAGVQAIFGPEAYGLTGAYNRPFVAQQAFADPQKLAALNALVHPAVEAKSLEWHQEMAQTGAPYTLKEAALMMESGSHRHLDFLIVVTAPEELRIQRVVARDGIQEEQVLARMKAQLPEADKVAAADFVIVNDGERQLIPQVLEAHRAILEKFRTGGAAVI